MKNKRQRKPDPITNFSDVGNQQQEMIYHALRPLDELVRQMERRWGVNRLVTLVSVDTAAKFGSAKAKLDQAIHAGDVQGVQKKAKVMMRAWKALSDEAAAAGHKGIDPKVWTATAEDGTPYAIVEGSAEAWKVTPELEGVRVFSVDEVARLLHTQFSLIGSVKDTFPDATVKSTEPLDDEVPF